MVSLFRWRNSSNLSTLCQSVSLYRRSGKQCNIDPWTSSKSCCKWLWYLIYNKGLQTFFFFIRGQTVNICGQEDHNVYVTTAQLCPCHLEAAADNIYTCGFIPVFIYRHLTCEFCITFLCHEIVQIFFSHHLKM